MKKFIITAFFALISIGGATHAMLGSFPLIKDTSSTDDNDTKISNDDVETGVDSISPTPSSNYSDNTRDLYGNSGKLQEKSRYSIPTKPREEKHSRILRQISTRTARKATWEKMQPSITNNTHFNLYITRGTDPSDVVSLEKNEFIKML